jgi:sugar lactone lactonase YvrE
MATTVGSGKYTYEVNENWAHLPEGWEMPAAAVAVDSQDRVYCYNRALDHPIIIFDREGNYLDSWGKGVMAFPHAIKIDDEDQVWLIDRDHGQIMKFTPKGDLLQTIGTKGYRSDTGLDPTDFSSSGWKRVTHGGGPFNLPTDVAFAPDGDLFISDGHGNCEVHKFTAEGKYLFSWGAPGNGPSQFNLPHGVWLDRKGRLLLADRENDRVQVFSQSGDLIGIWPTELIGPAIFYVDADDIVYIPEHNGGMVSILTLEGERLARWGSPIHRSCHGIWGDSHGDLYVVMPGEWGRTRRVVKFLRKG